MTHNWHLSCPQCCGTPNPISLSVLLNSSMKLLLTPKAVSRATSFTFLCVDFLSIKRVWIFRSLVYLLISFIYLSLSHPPCRSSLSPTLIPYQPTSHPSPCCLSSQIHHPPICLMLPMLWDDLLRESHWWATEGGWDRGGIRKLQGNAKRLHTFPQKAFSSFHDMVINCCVCFPVICLFSSPANSGQWENSQGM